MHSNNKYENSKVCYRARIQHYEYPRDQLPMTIALLEDSYSFLGFSYVRFLLDDRLASHSVA